MKTKLNVVHMEGWKPKYLQISYSVIANMTNRKNDCKNIQSSHKWLVVAYSCKLSG
jgi:hypothetical protein